MILQTFISRKKRDIEAEKLREQGYLVSCRTSHNQLLYPMYVEDYLKKVTQEEKSFDNMIHNTYFKTLYHLQTD